MKEHLGYDVAAAKERLREGARGQIVGYSWPAYDPYKPRTLDHRQAEMTPWLLEAILITVIFIAAVGILVMASLSSRG